jgi:hypothetical protein
VFVINYHTRGLKNYKEDEVRDIRTVNAQSRNVFYFSGLSNNLSLVSVVDKGHDRLNLDETSSSFITC